MADKFTVHFFDAARPDDDDVFPVYVYSTVVPRVGDHVHYHVDDAGHNFEGAEPGTIKGRVAKVEIEYRRTGHSVPVLVSVYLDDYQALAPKGWRQGRSA